MRDQLNAGPTSETIRTWKRYTSFTHPFILTRWIWKDDYDGQIIFGDLMGLKFPDICLTGEENPRKKPHQGNLSRTGIKPGPAAWQTRMLPPAPQNRYLIKKQIGITPNTSSVKNMILFVVKLLQSVFTMKWQFRRIGLLDSPLFSLAIPLNTPQMQ